MLRMHLVALLGLSLVVVAKGDDPKPVAETKPQWQRQLTGIDALQAANLVSRIKALEAADNYVDAIRKQEELLAFRTRKQGPDHWETANEKWAVAAMKKVAALPEEKRAGWRLAEKGESTAAGLEQKAEYGKAKDLRQERLKWCLEVLGEDHPYTAYGYNNVATNLNGLGKYREAGQLHQKALDIYRKILGEDNPFTAEGYNSVGVNLMNQGKFGEASPLLQRALEIRQKTLGDFHLVTADSYSNLASNLDELGKHAEARPLYQKALDCYRKVLGENHPATARGYNNFGASLSDQGRYGEAGPLFQKALDIRRKALGEEHPATATSYNNLAVNLNAQGKYAEAAQPYQKALEIARKVLGEDHPDTAQSYNNVAYNLTRQGKFVEAEPLYQRALDINRKILGEQHPSTGANYLNCASNLDNQKKYMEARPLHLKALDIFRKALGENHPSTATSYFKVASNLSLQGKYLAAEPLYQKALEIKRTFQGEEHPSTATIYLGVASNLGAQGRYTDAGPLYQKALDIRRKVLGEDHLETAESYFRLGENQFAQGKYQNALASLQSSARSYEVARLNVAVGGFERAAFGVDNSPYPCLVAARIRAGRSVEAWAALEADMARGLLDESALRQGLTLAEQRQCDEIRAKKASIDTRILAIVGRAQGNNTKIEELETLLAQRLQLEKSLGILADSMSQREGTSLAQVQAALPVDGAFLAWVDDFDRYGEIQEHLACVVRKEGPPHWERLPGSGPEGKWTSTDTDLLMRFHMALKQSAPPETLDPLVKAIRDQRLTPLQKHLNGVKRLIVAPVNWMAGIPIELLTDQYTISYTPSGSYLARFKNRPRLKGSGFLAVGDPVFPPAKEMTRPASLPPGGLLIIQVQPGGPAATARLQGGDVFVAYAGQDITSIDQFSKLIAANAKEKTIVVKVWREGQEKLGERELPTGRLGIALANEPAREAIASRRQSDQLLAQLTRGESYAELPGTQVEVARLAELFDPKDVTRFIRSEATEQRLDELRKAEKLKQFRFLHFATHGKANLVRAFDSALLLTPPKRPAEVRIGEPYLEGRLTAAEVMEYWHLDAELVTLSACESGQGRFGGGDGLLGFAQAFLMAGSRSVCLTLWQVDDTATALLMDRFYRNLLGKREGSTKAMGKAAALREAKEWLRNLTASEALERLGTLTQGVVRGERPARDEMPAVPKPKDAGKDYRPYAHPRYWAAFILIGDPE